MPTHTQPRHVAGDRDMAHRHLAAVISLTEARQKRDRPPATATRAEVAEALGVSPRTVTRYMDRGMPFERAYENGAVRFDIPECKAWRRRHHANSAG